jgi:hypothetical protein
MKGREIMSTGKQMDCLWVIQALKAYCAKLSPEEKKQIAVPYRSRIQSWLELAPLSLCDYAIRRASRKCWKAPRKGRPLNARQARAYAENVLRNEMEQQKAGDGQAGWSVSGKEEQEARAQ